MHARGASTKQQSTNQSVEMMQQQIKVTNLSPPSQPIRVSENANPSHQLHQPFSTKSVN
jgi:hypothetical protein